MASIMEGTAVFKTPVSGEALMKSFTGRYYRDVTGDTPSDEAQRQNLEPAQILQEHAPRGADQSLVGAGVTRVLIRHHELPRLALFNPLRKTNCPVPIDEMTGRETIVKPDHGGSTVTIKDTIDVVRNLQDRWTGETRFELL